jgi:hypothetical protein
VVLRAPLVIRDALTAKVLGLMVICLMTLIDVSTIMFTKADPARPLFPLFVVLPSLPIFAFGAYLLQRGFRMKDDDE